VVVLVLVESGLLLCCLVGYVGCVWCKVISVGWL
jgi:hypothetical protein